ERIVEWMHKRPTRLGQQLVQPLEGLSGITRLQVDGRAVVPRRLELLLAHAVPHHDQRIDTLESGAVRERLSVVPGRDSDHATSLFVGRQRRKLVEHAARLERAGALK